MKFEISEVDINAYMKLSCYPYKKRRIWAETDMPSSKTYVDEGRGWVVIYKIRDAKGCQ